MQLKSLFFVLSLGLASQALAAPFEGVVTYQMTHGKEEAREMKISMAGGKWRIDGAGPKEHGGAIIVDPKAHSSLMLMDEQKMYMRHVYEPKPAKAGLKPKMRKTGKSDTIAGYKADEWEISSGGKLSSIWATKDLGGAFFAMDGGPQGKGGDGFEIPEALKKDGFFPLRMESHGERGSKMEATKVEAKGLDASLFEIPAGYKEMKMGSLPGGMHQMTPEQLEMLKKMTHKGAQ